jgi:hypothetical protein
VKLASVSGDVAGAANGSGRVALRTAPAAILGVALASPHL